MNLFLNLLISYIKTWEYNLKQNEQYLRLIVTKAGVLWFGLQA